MKTVGIRELRNHLSEIVRIVRGGASVLVTDRGEVVAELRPPSGQAWSHPGLEDLVNSYGARIGAPNSPDLYETGPVRCTSGTARALLDEERGER